MLFLYNVLQIFLFISFLFAIYGIIFCKFLIEKIFNLIAVFICLSFWLILYGFEFLSLVILLLYVGSIAVLFLFVVIIINPDYNEILEEKFLFFNSWKIKNQFKYTNQKNKNFILKENFYFLIGIFLGILIIFISNISLKFYSFLWINLKKDSFILTLKHNTILDIYYLSELLYGNFSFALLIIGLILLLAIIGVILLTIKKSFGLKRQNIHNQFFRYR